jgi:thiol:disulfide interchange protein DsbD
MLWPVLSGAVQMMGWAVLAILTAALLRAFDTLPQGAGVAQRLLKGVGILFALIGALQAVGVASGGHDPLQPLAHLARGDAATAPLAVSGAVSQDRPGGGGVANSARAIVGDGPAMNEAPDKAEAGSWMRQGPSVVPGTSSSTGFTRIRTVAELDALVASSDRPVMLDFYADWCVSCKEMEALTFPKPAVRDRLAQLHLVQADVTANNADDRELLKRFKLFGPPGIVFFAPGGQVLTGIRVIGFQGAERFAGTLDKVLAATSPR